MKAGERGSIIYKKNLTADSQVLWNIWSNQEELRWRPPLRPQGSQRNCEISFLDRKFAMAQRGQGSPWAASNSPHTTATPPHSPPHSGPGPLEQQSWALPGRAPALGTLPPLQWHSSLGILGTPGSHGVPIYSSASRNTVFWEKHALFGVAGEFCHSL